VRTIEKQHVDLNDIEARFGKMFTSLEKEPVAGTSRSLFHRVQQSVVVFSMAIPVIDDQFNPIKE